MCKIPGQPNRWSRNFISRIKILISNPPVQNMKTCPKCLNYWYAGFQILDWNSNFQSPLIRTTDKLLWNFTRKDPVYYKFIYENIVYKKNFIHKNGQWLSHSHLSFPSFSLPHYDTILHIGVIIIFIQGSHIFFFMISNFILLERPLSLKLMLSPL